IRVIRFDFFLNIVVFLLLMSEAIDHPGFRSNILLRTSWYRPGVGMVGAPTPRPDLNTLSASHFDRGTIHAGRAESVRPAGRHNACPAVTIRAARAEAEPVAVGRAAPAGF